MKIKESELKAILDEVAADLSKCFEDEKEKLVKAFPEGAPEGSSSSDESSKSAAPEASSSEGSSSSDEGSKADGSVPPPPPAASPSPVASPSATPTAPVAPPVADPAAAPAADAAPVTPEVLHAEYLKMMQEDPAQFAMHVAALDTVKAATAGASPSPAPTAPVAPAVPPAPMDAMKAELSPSPERVGGPHVEVVHKSEDVSRFETVMKSYETKVAELEAKLKSQAEEQVAVQQVLTRIVERPMRKSIESMVQVAAPVKTVDLAKMSKDDVSKRLSTAARTNLSKSDRSLINQFYTGQAKLEQLAHLFDAVK